jgi:hypothetical protein
MDNSIEKRGHALEEIFFKNVDAKLLEKMRQDMKEKEVSESLQHASGIKDQKVLQSLREVGVTAESLTALSLIPLVAVAWADGKVQREEREAILKAANESDIAAGSDAEMLLNSWLNVQPGPELMEAWKGYAACVKASLDATLFHQMSEAILNRAQQLAKASGGFLGLSAISLSESKVLDELKAVLS